MKQIVSHMAVKFEVKISLMTFSSVRLARWQEKIYLDRINSAFFFKPIRQIGAISETIDLIDQSVKKALHFSERHCHLFTTLVPIQHEKHDSSDQIAN